MNMELSLEYQGTAENAMQNASLSRRVRALLADLIRIAERGDHPQLAAQIKVIGDE